MTTDSEWPQGVEPMPSIEPSSDLFDGDILGDELIDIYNAAVVGGGGGDDDMHEIPSLLAPTPEPDRKNNPAPTAHAEIAPSTNDDGLGAFRPSTSFNDLTTLLPAGTTPVSKSTQVAPVAAPAPAIQRLPADSRKRAAEVAAVPSAKRRISAPRKAPAPANAALKAKSKVAHAPGSKSATGAGKPRNTPNPLTIVSATNGAPKVLKTQPVKAVKPPAAPVVTPRGPPKTNPPAPAEASSAAAPAPTEADFKSVAQAAVSNLIMNAGNGKSDASKKGSNGENGSEKIDTSTEHIKALTGSNWVAVCAGGDGNQNANAASDKMNNRARRQNLTPDERARQNRDRNREHARNTRLRKKAYVEELKRTLTALVTQRDATDLEKRHSAQRELEQREVRFRVIEEFLKLRGRNEVNFARWAAILEESFSLTLPHTDYRESSGERGQFEQVISGVSQAMADSGLFSSFLQTLGKGAGVITFAYNCDRKNFFMDNCTALLDWTASSQGAVDQGAPAELVLRGNLKAKFSPASNKLISVAMSFDTGIIMSQLNHSFKGAGQEHIDADAAAAAAQVAASEAGAILDSLEMPHIAPASVPSNVTLVPPSAPASVTDGEKSDSSDESNVDDEDAAKAVTVGRAILATN